MDKIIENLNSKIGALRVPLSHERLMAAVEVALEARQHVASGELTPRQETNVRRNLNEALGDRVFLIDVRYSQTRC